MKKKLFFVFFMFLALASWAQVSIENKTGYSISVSETKESQAITLLNGGEPKTVSWFTPNATSVVVYLKYLKNGRVETVGRITKNVVGSRVIFQKDDLARANESEAQTTNTDSPHNSLGSASVEKNSSSKDILVRPVNKSASRLVFLDGPFRGVSLRENATSSSKFLVPLGLVQSAIFYDIDPTEQSTGRNYAQAVFSKIVTEGDSLLVITDLDLTPPESEKKKIKLRSKLPYKIVITGGAFSGASISPGKYWKKVVDVHYGFNRMSAQYFDNQHKKVQINIELIITPSDTVISIWPGDVSIQN